jgi:hypothetical protein
MPVVTTTAANAALDRMEADEDFASRVKDAGGADASIELLRAEGFDTTPEEMRDAALDRYSDSLTVEQLDAIAAGAEPDIGGALLMTGAMVVAGAAAAAV